MAPDPLSLLEPRLAAALTGDDLSGATVAHVERIEARAARYGDPREPLHQAVLDRLAARGYAGLYSHQATAVDLLAEGRSIVVATGTASGKSLCYQVPIVEAALDGRRETVLALFPTKALAHDQLRSLRSWLVPDLVCAPYDGDATFEEKAWARRHASVILTNPDMLHIGILPFHDRWATFFMRLRYVVVDELHVLRGVFGSHVALVLRRLRRLCERYGSSPQFVFTSATVGNAGALAAMVCGLDVVVVDDDGSPRSARTFVLFDRAVVDERRGTRASANQTTGRLLAGLVREGFQTLAFSRSRVGVELVARSAKASLRSALDDAAWAGCGDAKHIAPDGAAGGIDETGPAGTAGAAAAYTAGAARPNSARWGRTGVRHGADETGTEGTARPAGTTLPGVTARARSVNGLVAAYRGGYLTDERRDLEQRFSSGELRGIAATNALELGIDIGGLDAIVINGFPGTISSLWQQAGRAGRRAGSAHGEDGGPESLAVLVAGDDQLDRWYFTHPEELFSRPPEAAVINPSNPYVLLPHIACAAYEAPLESDDRRWFGDGIDTAACDLVRVDLARPRDGRLFWAAREPPAPAVNLRSSSGRVFRLEATDTDRTIGTVDGSRVCSVAHPGAIYVHQGRQYRVDDLDLPAHTARLSVCDDDEYTQTRHETDIEIMEQFGSAEIGSLMAGVGRVRVTSQVTAYQRRCLSTGDVLEVVPLDLPAQLLDTSGCWFTITPDLLGAAGLVPARTAGTVHAIEHGFIGMLPRSAICDRWDVGGVSMAIHPQTGLPSIFVYDGFPGGAGIADIAFAVAAETLAAVAELIGACPCDEGCPSCVQSPKCGNWNEYLDKVAAMAVLAVAIGPAAAPAAQRSGRGIHAVSTTARATASTPRRRTRTVA